MITGANICTYFSYNDHQCQAVKKQQSKHLQKAACLQLHAQVPQSVLFTLEATMY